jgi:hypothetical protein
MRHIAVPLCSLVIASAAATAGSPALAAADPTAEAFSFAVIADVPYSTREEPIVAEVLRAIGTSEDRFVVHLGDMKGPNELCSDEILDIRKTLLDSSPKPLVLLPGGLDWVACSASQSGGYDAPERLTQLREIMFGADQSLGEQTMLIARQSGMKRFREFPENVRWQAGQVLFVGLNLPAPDNNFRFAAGRNGEFEDRQVANRTWLERAFAYAQTHHLPAVVILCQADPSMSRVTRMIEGSRGKRDGFFEFKNTLRELTMRYRGQVLFVHGAGPESTANAIVNDALAKGVKNLLEVHAYGSPETDRWIEIRVDTRRVRIFTVIPKGLESANRPKPDHTR